MKKYFFHVLILIFTLLYLAACGGDDTNQQATADALSQSIVQTATAKAIVPVEVEDEVESVATIQAEATEQGEEVQATEVAVATEEAVAEEATEIALSPIQTELITYGVDPSEGELAWVHDPVEIDVEGYLQYGYENDYSAKVIADFVMVADVTWNTQFGSTGCGFVVRSDGNEESLNQYAIIATRGAQGHVGFIVQREGEPSIDESQDIYANGIDPLFEWQNDTTNRLAVVGRGDTFTLFTNGIEIGKIQTEAGFDKGFVAFVALNESGTTHCEFDNAWLWDLS